MTAPIVGRLEVSVFNIPTEGPESDGTFEWRSTTLVVVEASGGGQSGLGYTYGDASVATFIRHTLAPQVEGTSVLAVSSAWEAMRRAVRNSGRPGLSSMGIAAVDVALWDLKARWLGLPLVELLGPVHERVPIYGSGGFTSYSAEQLENQLGGWARSGISRVKMKVGRRPGEDAERVRIAREAIGGDVELFVDANGAYSRKQALGMAEEFDRSGVTWFEEPVSSDDLEGLRLLRDRAPAGMAIAAGEYGYDLPYFDRMLGAGAVDILQADATRCAGYTEFLRVSALAAARGIPLSSHTAPALHLPVCAATPGVCHMEYFHDHARIEQLIFEGTPAPEGGSLSPDRSRPGSGLTLKKSEARCYAA